MNFSVEMSFSSGEGYKAFRLIDYQMVQSQIARFKSTKADYLDQQNETSEPKILTASSNRIIIKI